MDDMGRGGELGLPPLAVTVTLAVKVTVTVTLTVTVTVQPWLGYPMPLRLNKLPTIGQRDTRYAPLLALRDFA